MRDRITALFRHLVNLVNLLAEILYMQQAVLDLQNNLATAQASLTALQTQASATVTALNQAHATNASLIIVVGNLISTANALKDETVKLIAAASGQAPTMAADDLAGIQAASQAFVAQAATAKQLADSLAVVTATAVADTQVAADETDKASQANQLDSPTN